MIMGWLETIILVKSPPIIICGLNFALLPVNFNDLVWSHHAR